MRMLRTSFAPFLLTAVLLSGCSQQTNADEEVDIKVAQFAETESLTSEEKDEKYQAFLEEVLESALGGMAGVEEVKISVTYDETGKPIVDVKLTLNGSSEEPEKITKSIEEVISKFFEDQVEVNIEM